MRRELEKYLYQSNDELLNLFKNGNCGEAYFGEFVRLIKEEGIEEVITLSDLKQGIKGESQFIRFMSILRKKLVPFDIRELSPEDVERIKNEIRVSFGE